MYILINKNTNRVVNTSKQKPLSYSDNLLLAEVESLPQSYDYLIAENIREKTDTWQEVIEDYDDNGNIVAKTEERSRTYFSCDLVAKFRPQPTAEQLEVLKEKKYNARVTQLVRVKYDANAVEALLANYAENKEKYQAEFDVFAAYRKQCKEQAHKEVWGE